LIKIPKIKNSRSRIQGFPSSKILETMPKLSKLFEFRIFLILAIIALAWYLLGVFASFFTFFSDVFLLVVLSWILAFILEPLVVYLSKGGVNRTAAAAIIYLAIALLTGGLIYVIIPTIVSQFTQLASIAPTYLPQNLTLTPQIESFLTSSLSNSVQIASQVASGVTAFILVFILSFYLLISKNEISQAIKDLIPDEYEEDYAFLENVLNNTFASFLRVQVLLGLALGAITFLTLLVLNVHFALSTSIVATILAMIPVIGGILFVLPAALAALTISFNKMIIVVIVLVLAAQLVFNLLGPKLLGKALKIHPIVVFVSFLVGYKIAGVWGAVFAVPVTSSILIIVGEVLKYWKQEADKQ